MQPSEVLYQQHLEERRSRDLLRQLPLLTPADQGRLRSAGEEYVNFSSNDYLGLSRHPALIDAAGLWARRYGAGSGASRLVTGNLEAFAALEDKVAAFKGKEAALIMVSGFQANASMMSALFDKRVLGDTPLLFCDKRIHASMHVGIAASGVRQQRFAHNDMAHLQRLLEKHADSQAPKFILCESVYSMDGDRAPLDSIADLASEHGAFLICDEAHATAVLGPKGSGLASRADLVLGTFSKGFGCFGAYIACSQVLKDYLINQCPGLVYATALPPQVLGSIDAALDLVPEMDRERSHLKALSDRFREELQHLGHDTGDSCTQIVPLILGEAGRTLSLSQTLRERGFWATAIRPPTVPEGAARIRFAFSALHSEDDLDHLLRCIREL